jgi:energy-coupling factor transport system substrate-specific component
MTTTAASYAPRGAKGSYWSARDLVVIGVFAAAAKLASVLIALVGAGMNPVSLLLKNLVFTTLLIVMLFKVRKSGTLLLFTAVNSLVSLLLLGGNVTLIPPAFAAALLAEGAILVFGGAKKTAAVYAGVALFDLASKALSLGVSFLFMRETPALVMVVVPFIVIGYAGSLLGLWAGAKSVKELRHAGIVRS